MIFGFFDWFGMTASVWLLMYCAFKVMMWIQRINEDHRTLHKLKDTVYEHYTDLNRAIANDRLQRSKK